MSAPANQAILEREQSGIERSRIVQHARLGLVPYENADAWQRERARLIANGERPEIVADSCNTTPVYTQGRRGGREHVLQGAGRADCRYRSGRRSDLSRAGTARPLATAQVARTRCRNCEVTCAASRKSPSEALEHLGSRLIEWWVGQESGSGTASWPAWACGCNRESAATAWR